MKKEITSISPKKKALIATLAKKTNNGQITEEEAMSILSKIK
jgi:hypothetical protein